ncbi:FAD/NAD(P)-binding domain-containing protein [Copromyces sp. CBS 386.78]|nr:FAD/NAD(P)-binding domain-containing protein [Copromyces sp. CBS 386.78]
MAFSHIQPIGAAVCFTSPAVSFGISTSKDLRSADEPCPSLRKTRVDYPRLNINTLVRVKMSMAGGRRSVNINTMIDILIIGAGSSGLCAAKTFLQHNPNSNMLILDSHSTVGGVWSKERLYPTLRTNNLYPTMDFSDFPMKDVGIGRPGHHITGEEMHAYLTAYAQHFDLMKRIRFNTRAVRLVQAPTGDGWGAEIQEPSNPISTITTTTTTLLETKKLIMATGILGVPNMPSLAGSSTFDAPLLHSSALGPQYQSVLQNPNINRVAVLGGSKSAYDTVYLAATTGHKVDWIIRKSGRGPSWVFPSHTKIGPFKAWREKLVNRRISTFMSPCVLPDHSGKQISWIREFLHTTKVGKAVANGFWKTMHEDTIRDCRYRDRDSKEGKDSEGRFSVLEPDHSPFWYGTSSGTLNYEQDFKALVTSGQVTVHREDISHLSPHTIHFTDNAGAITVNALICATGYSAKPPVDFFPRELHFQLGIPTSTDSLTEEQKAAWAEYDKRADDIIGKRFPQLLSPPMSTTHNNNNTNPSSPPPSPPQTPSSFFPSIPPKPKPKPKPKPESESDTTKPKTLYTPWRLHRGIAPPGLTCQGNHSLVFLSMHSSITNMPRIELQCLWSLSYFHDKIFRDTAIFQRWCALRSPLGHGGHYPDLNFDQLPYWDWLVGDMRLEVRRKGGRWWRELLSSYGSKDYRGLVREWIEKYGKDETKDSEMV